MKFKLIAKFRGVLVILNCKAYKSIEIETFKCFDCKSHEYHIHAGWINCKHCNFSVNEKSFNRAIEKFKNLDT